MHRFSLIPIQISPKTHGIALLTMFLAIIMIAGALQKAMPSQAADLVCGDGVMETPEQCDDGNLQSGDGCSNSCTVELCGNLIIDASEQCDDGNLQSGDGCNRYCQREFCGDRMIQETRGEQCDDGNGIAGDGCSSSCLRENAPDSVSSSAPRTPQVTPPPTLPPPQSVPSPTLTLAAQVAQFMSSDAAQDYMEHLTDAQVIQLETIVKKLATGRRLTATERAWALELYGALQDAKLAERTRYTDLLKQFIATPISADVVEERNLDATHLVDVEVPVAIEELARAVEVIRRGELASAVTVDVARLKRQGIDLSHEAPEGYETYLDAGDRPISVFATLKTLKEAAEKHATTDVPSSLERVRSEAQTLKQSLPLFEQEYGLKPEDIEPLLTAIEQVSEEVTKQDLERVVAAINRFLGALERKTVLSRADIAAFTGDLTHTAAAAQRIAETVGIDGREIAPENIVPMLTDASASAPAEVRPIFERGSVADQREALLALLTKNDRIQQLRQMLRERGETDADARYEELQSAIASAGDVRDTVTICDDSVPDALQCINEYLTDLEDAARGRNFFTRLIGRLQDFFGIGS